MPAGTSNQAGAKAAVRQIRSILSEAGVDGAAIQTTTYPGARDDEQAPITLSFMTFAALAQECGQNWSENIAFTPRNLPWPEFGCSTQRNFAASVSNPMDLKAPRAEGKSDALRRGVVLSKYRVGQPTGATMSDDASGSVSEVK